MCTNTPSTRSSIEMSSNCSTSSTINFCLLTLTTSAALPEFRRANLNFRRESLTAWGISTVWDYVRRHGREIHRRKRGIPSFVLLGVTGGYLQKSIAVCGALERSDHRSTIVAGRNYLVFELEPTHSLIHISTPSPTTHRIRFLPKIRVCMLH